MGDADYLALFKYVFMPILKEFDPQLIIVSAGFDCGAGDILGPMKVTNNGFKHMTKYIMNMAPGKAMFCLEGGYELECTANGVQACIETLLGDPLTPYENPNDLIPSYPGFNDIMKCIKFQKNYWKCLQALDNDQEFQVLKKTLSSSTSCK